MSTAKKTLYATIGAGEVALAKAREFSSRLVEIPSRAGSLRDLPKAAASIGTEGSKRATSLLRTGTTRVQELATETRKRSAKEYAELAERGEKLVGTIRRSAPAKRAAEQTKAAKSKVKAASTSVAKAAHTQVEAVSSAAEKIEEATASV